MRISCKICGDFFCLNEETAKLISDGFISIDTVDTCDDCFELLKIQDSIDLSDLVSDADRGLK